MKLDELRALFNRDSAALPTSWTSSEKLPCGHSVHGLAREVTTDKLGRQWAGRTRCPDCPKGVHFVQNVVNLKWEAKFDDPTGVGPDKNLIGTRAPNEAECESCGMDGRDRAITWQDGRTMYEPTLEDPFPNKPVALCQPCADEHHEYWNDMFAEANAGRL